MSPLKRPFFARTNPNLRDRRRFRRWNVNLPVRELRPEQHLMRATSISAGGLFCPDAQPRAEGSGLLLEIDLLGAGQPLLVTARVAHCGTSAEGFGLGLAFDQPQRDLSDRLRAGPTGRQAP